MISNKHRRRKHQLETTSTPFDLKAYNSTVTQIDKISTRFNENIAGSSLSPRYFLLHNRMGNSTHSFKCNLRRHVIEKRMKYLRISWRHQIPFTSSLAAGVHTMDVDPVDNRYLLCGAARGEISIVDLERPFPTDSRSRVEHIVTPCGAACLHKSLITYCQWYPQDTSTFISSDRVGKVKSFKDKKYRKRREWFWDIANNHKHGTPIPRIDYTTSETRTWGTIYRDLKILHNKYACTEFLDNFKLLEKQCGYSDNQIPQLEDISNYLQIKTGFTLRPCGGYLTPRNFLAALAFRVFCCTQYMRHHTDPHYTPEPDLCHEMLGHMAMFLDPTYAQLSQEIGIASLGSTEKDCSALIRLYFFTFEFGLLAEKFSEKKQNMKVYGAGLLSCFDELKFCVSPEAKIYRFDPNDAVETEPEIMKFQKGYFYTSTISEAFDKIKTYISTIKRPFSLQYDPLTQSIKRSSGE